MEATAKKIVSERRSRGIGGKVCMYCHSNIFIRMIHSLNTVTAAS